MSKTFICWDVHTNDDDGQLFVKYSPLTSRNLQPAWRNKEVQIQEFDSNIIVKYYQTEIQKMLQDNAWLIAEETWERAVWAGVPRGQMEGLTADSPQLSAKHSDYGSVETQVSTKMTGVSCFEIKFLAFW